MNGKIAGSNPAWNSNHNFARQDSNIQKIKAMAKIRVGGMAP